MRAAILDPSCFTFPYDHELCSALSALGAHVLFLRRRLRPPERDYLMDPESYGVSEHFYRLSDQFGTTLRPAFMYRGIKGVEHLVGMIRLRAALAEWKPGVIHFQWLPVPVIDRMFLRSLRRLAPLILTVHDTRPFHGNPSSRFQLLGWRGALGGFDHLIVHTQFSRRNLLQAGLPEGKVAVIPMPVFRPRLGSAPRRNSELVGGEGVATVLFFGLLKPYKGVDTLLQAFARLPPSVLRKARLRIAGKPYMDVKPLRDLARRLGIDGRVSWTLRFVPELELDALFRDADVVVFPYRDVDSSAVLMKTLPYGKPIVASRLGVFGELLQDGVHGRLVAPHDPIALAQALTSILQDGSASARMGERVRALSQSLLTWTDFATRTLAVYRRARREWENSR